jgi:amino acid transporter
LINSLFNNRLRRILAPTYDELTLFVISFTCILFLATEFKSFLGHNSLSFTSNGFAPLVLLAVIATGISLSLHHSFSTRVKSRLEKQLMFLFASLVNGFTGIWGATYLLSRAEGWNWILLFPVLNLISSYLILAQPRDRFLDESCIDDRNVRLREVAVSALIVAIGFFVSREYLQHHWAATLSICVAYGTNLNRVIVNLLFPEREQRNTLPN